MRARRFSLHDREDVGIKRFDRCNRIAVTNLDAAIGNDVDAVATGLGNRCHGKPEHVIGDNGAVDLWTMSLFKEDACHDSQFRSAARQKANGVECRCKRHGASCRYGTEAWLPRCDAATMRWNAKRSPGVGAEGDDYRTARHSDRRS